MLTNKNAVIFDFDGTLVDSMWMWREIDIDFLKTRNLPFPEDLQNCIEGLSFVETAEYFKTHFPLEESVEDLMKLWNKMAMDKYRYEVELKPGALEFLEYLKQQGIKMGIATSNSRELILGFMETHRLEEYMDCVVTANEIKHGKPAPDIYIRAAEILGVKPEHCLVFEDLSAGITAGRRAGMETCAVWDSYSADQDEKKRQLADYYIHEFTEILTK